MKIYYVDLPNPNKTSEDDAWINMEICFSKSAALKYLKKEFNIGSREAEVFIIEGET